jgi:hypothetical protein
MRRSPGLDERLGERRGWTFPLLRTQSLVMDVRQLLRSIPETFETADRERVVVFGSAAIALRGGHLGRAPDDLDLFAAPGTLTSLAQKGFALTSSDAAEGGKIGKITVADKVDVFETFPGTNFDEVRRGAGILPPSEGFAVASLDDLRKAKLARGKAKDLLDIAALDRSRI